jgi:hypothetical protein
MNPAQSICNLLCNNSLSRLICVNCNTKTAENIYGSSSLGLFTRDEFPFYRIGTRSFSGNGTAINATQSVKTRTVKIITNLHASPPRVFQQQRESVNTAGLIFFSRAVMGLARNKYTRGMAYVCEFFNISYQQ